jgi:predicted TIM-barrel fold metal-dependent hydrolase
MGAGEGRRRPFTEPTLAERLIADMDRAGIRRALVLSEAFWVGGGTADPARRLIPSPDRVTAAGRENDWAAEQVARFPDRLSLACGLNPLEDYALSELERCSRMPQAVAVKMNISEGGDNADLRNPAHVAKLRRLFAAANERRMAIVIHMGSAQAYGAAEVRIFLDEIMPAAPNIPVQIAHLSSGLQHPEALSAFADARAAGERAAANLYFDMSVGSFRDLPPERGRFLADAIRRIGLEHVLYASDQLPGDHHAPTWQHWEEMRRTLPLTPDEFTAIADNVAPYMAPRR